MCASFVGLEVLGPCRSVDGSLGGGDFTKTLAEKVFWWHDSWKVQGTHRKRRMQQWRVETRRGTLFLK